MADNATTSNAPIEGGALIFKHHYDREDEVETKESLMQLLKSLQEWAARNTHPEIQVEGKPYVIPIRDTVAIGEIRKVLSKSKYLLQKYKEKESAEKISTYIEFLTEQRELDTIVTIRNLEYLSDMLAMKLGIRHGFKDRIDDKMPWDREVKKKLEFPDFTPYEQEFYNSIDREWKQEAFLTTFYVVRCNGDAHILLSGPNLSGKTSTALPFLIQCNKYLREFWKVDRYNEYYIKEHPEAKGEKLRKFNIERDVYVTPSSEGLKERFKNEQYQTIDINEGMEAATNLGSMKAEAIQLGVRRFTTRSYHNIVVWEYQVQERPTAMMLEGMNFWFQKMKKRHFILSIASTLVRKKDPYYMKELDKCRTDKEIGLWMKKINPNYIHTFKSPKMGPKLEHRFQMWYWKSKDLQSKADKIKSNITADYTLMIDEIWQRVNVNHTLGFIEIGEELKSMGFNDKDVASFMRDYGKFNRQKLWEGYKTKELEVVKNG